MERKHKSTNMSGSTSKFSKEDFLQFLRAGHLDTEMFERANFFIREPDYPLTNCLGLKKKIILLNKIKHAQVGISDSPGVNDNSTNINSGLDGTSETLLDTQAKTGTDDIVECLKPESMDKLQVELVDSIITGLCKRKYLKTREFKQFLKLIYIYLYKKPLIKQLYEICSSEDKMKESTQMGALSLELSLVLQYSAVTNINTGNDNSNKPNNDKNCNDEGVYYITWVEKQAKKLLKFYSYDYGMFFCFLAYFIEAFNVSFGFREEARNGLYDYLKKYKWCSDKVEAGYFNMAAEMLELGIRAELKPDFEEVIIVGEGEFNAYTPELTQVGEEKKDGVMLMDAKTTKSNLREFIIKHLDDHEVLDITYEVNKEELTVKDYVKAVCSGKPSNSKLYMAVGRILYAGSHQGDKEVIVENLKELVKNERVIFKTGLLCELVKFGLVREQALWEEFEFYKDVQDHRALSFLLIECGRFLLSSKRSNLFMRNYISKLQQDVDDGNTMLKSALSYVYDKRNFVDIVEVCRTVTQHLLLGDADDSTGIKELIVGESESLLFRDIMFLQPSFWGSTSELVAVLVDCGLASKYLDRYTGYLNSLYLGDSMHLFYLYVEIVALIIVYLNMLDSISIKLHCILEVCLDFNIRTRTILTFFNALKFKLPQQFVCKSIPTTIHPSKFKGLFGEFEPVLLENLGMCDLSTKSLYFTFCQENHIPIKFIDEPDSSESSSDFEELFNEVAREK